MQLTITKEELPHREARLDVVIPWTEVQGAYEKAMTHLMGQVTMPGFRKGKVPRPMVEKRFGESVKQEAVEELLPRVWEVAAKEQDIKPYGQARVVDLTEWKDGESIRAKYQVSLQPVCELKDAAGLTLQEPQTSWDEADVLAEVTRILRGRAELVDGSGTVEENSWIRVSVTFQEEALKAEGLHHAPFLVESIADRPLPFKKTDVLGMKAGEKKTLTRDWSAEFPIAGLAGKSGTFDLELVEVKEFKVPELTEEIAKEIGFRGADDLKARIRLRFEERVRNFRFGGLRRQILDQLRPRAKLEVAHETTHSVAHELMDRFYERNGVQGPQVERFLAAIGKTRDGIHHEFEELAGREIADELLTRELEKLFPVEVGDDAMTAEIERISTAIGRDAKELRKEMLKSGEFTALKRRLQQEALVAKVTAQAKVQPGEKVAFSKVDD